MEPTRIRGQAPGKAGAGETGTFSVCPAAISSGVSAARRPPFSWNVTANVTAALASLVVLAVVTPLGLASGEAVDQVAQAFGSRRALGGATPLADTLSRLIALVPLGEAGIRPHLLAALLGAGAVALLLAGSRTVAHAGGCNGAGPALVGVTLLTVSRPFLDSASVRAPAALDLCLLGAGVLLLETLRRAPARSAAGMGLAFLCGLAAGAGWPVRVGLWPLALWLTILALRRGERWPLLGPTLFVAGAAITLAAVAGAPLPDPASPVVSGATHSAGSILHDILMPSLAIPFGSPAAREVVAWVIDDAGVLGLLAGLLGSLLMVMRAPLQAVTLLLPWATAVAAALAAGNILLARLFIAGSLVAPVTMAVSLFAESFGRARAAVVLVLLVVVVVPPAMVGVGAALRQPARRNPAAVARHLDLAFETGALGAAPVLESQPSAQLAEQETLRWWRYGTAIGLQPAHATGIPAQEGRQPSHDTSGARSDAIGHPPPPPAPVHGPFTQARPILAPR
ncbi:MAG: hypothetical protein ABIS92_02085 [Polyangia bacterium]